MQHQLFRWLRNAKQLNIWNLTKVNGIHETKQEKKYETKFYFWRNKTKRNEISLFLLFRETSEISRNKFVVSLCFVFRETKKGCEMETPPAAATGTVRPPIFHLRSVPHRRGRSKSTNRFFLLICGLPQAFSIHLRSATIVYIGGAKDKINIYIVNVIFLKIVVLIRKFLNVGAAHIEGLRYPLICLLVFCVFSH
jgi:hypothetical protein